MLEPIDLSSYRGDVWVDRSCKLTDAEFEFHKAFIVASGGMVLSGDLISEMREESIRCLEKLIPSTGVAARFPDNRFETGWVELAGKKLLCLFNWEEEARTFQVPLPEGTFEVSDFWTDAPMGSASSTLTIPMEPHGGRVLVLVPKSSN